MPTEPASKRAVAFVDGQNLFYAPKLLLATTIPITIQRLWRRVSAKFKAGN